MTRPIITILAFIISFVQVEQAKAQISTADKAVLESLAAFLETAPAVEATFCWNDVTEGTLILQGKCFYMEMDEYKIYCNGTTKWFYNTAIDEVTSVPHNAASTDILDNPSAFFNNKIAQSDLLNKSIKKVHKEGNGEALTPLRVTYLGPDGGSYGLLIRSVEAKTGYPASFFTYSK